MKMIICVLLIIAAIIAAYEILLQNKHSFEFGNNNHRPMTQKERDSVVFYDTPEASDYLGNAEIVSVHNFKRMSIYDQELKSKYLINITLPPKFDKNNTYPMYMMTDGQWRGQDHAALYAMMENGEIEDIILVSIAFNNGNDTEDIWDIRYIQFAKKSERFLDFLTNNLVPYLSEIYNIDYRRSTLFGHSMGGLFIHYAIFNHDKYKVSPFHYYVEASPALFDVDSKVLIDGENDYFKRNKTLDKEIYLTVGDHEADGLNRVGLNLIKPDAERFLERAKEYGITAIDYEVFEGNHETYVSPMICKSAMKIYKVE